MSFSSVINLGTVSPAITQVKLYECTGDNTGCTGLTGYDVVNVNTFPITVTGINDNSNYIKVEALGTSCDGTIQSLLISGKPGTPTPTPTATGTPTPTPTVTPTPTPTPTATTSQIMVWNLLLCPQGTNATQVIAYSSNYDPGIVIKGSNGQCYTIAVTGYSSQTPITVSGEYNSCLDCFGDGGGEGPTELTFSVTTGCTNYQGTLTVNLEGGTGSGYYWSIISGPEGYPTGNQLNNATVTGLSNGDYAILVGDSDGANQSTNAIYNVTCASAPNNTAFANLVISSTKPSSAQCSSGQGYTFDLGSPSATFCNATKYTASGLTGLGQGNNYWLCYDGQTKQVYHPSNAGYFDTAGGCQTL
jgi:hypothetical protein